MKPKKNKVSRNGYVSEEVLEQFSDVDRDKIRQVWHESGKARSDVPSISEAEMEEALLNVHDRLGMQEEPYEPANGKTAWTPHRTGLVAAVIAVLVFGAGILLIPKTISVPNGTITAVELPDGSFVEMNSGTQIRYSRLFSRINRTVTLNGEAFFTVQDQDLPFFVRANGATVEVTGTEFNVRSWYDDPASETRVLVAEGEVMFYPSDDKNKSVTLTAGQISGWNHEMERPLNPESTSLGERLGWRDQKLIFQDQSLLVIFNELERRFDVNIDLETPEIIGHETLTIYYNEPVHVESVLEDICVVKGLRYTATANGYRVFRVRDGD